MDYCVSLRVKMKELEWITMGRNHCIPWTVGELVAASSGWTVINEEPMGLACSLVSDLQKGIMELTEHRDTYIGFEVKHGMGTIQEVLEFYQDLLKDCKEYPFTEVYGAIVS